jgi:hypothetical protein
MDPMHLGLAFPAYGVRYQAILRKIYDFEVASYWLKCAFPLAVLLGEIHILLL